MEAAAAALGGGPGPLLLLLGLAVFNGVGADGNATATSETKRLFCTTPENCTGNITQLRRRGHFSKCPEEYKHYCVKGRCRYVTVEQTPACVCERGYTGARCERVDIFYLRGDKGQIVVICLIAAMVALIVLVICICTCSHHCRKQRRRRKEEEMETLGKNSSAKNEDVLETDIA
ncbi:probetacellulin isoform X1 [Alligator mississippiensis]|uniref:probetacellulin isoform X1 n=1 Tax=Alligator mississippiensis TaxID=8496 RepID=UPI0028773DE4|nr:probetacellulin isoform X1 [Alligator mississippiensis]